MSVYSDKVRLPQKRYVSTLVRDLWKIRKSGPGRAHINRPINKSWFSVVCWKGMKRSWSKFWYTVFLSASKVSSPVDQLLALQDIPSGPSLFVSSLKLSVDCFPTMWLVGFCKPIFKFRKPTKKHRNTSKCISTKDTTNMRNTLLQISNPIIG